MYFLWSLPALAVFAAIGSGRLSTTQAASLGLFTAIPIAALTGPLSPGADQLALALARGLWIGATLAPYILGGLLFWQVAARGAVADATASASDTESNAAHASGLERRRLLFFACFLVGPFAESATGFGVGMLGTVALIRRLGLKPRHLMVFALFSQTMIPWGGMGSGTLLAAAYARMPAAELGLYSMIPVTLLMLVWLPLFWRTANRAGLGASFREGACELGWIFAALALLAPATVYLGPETAMLAAYGPLIVLRYLVDWRPDRRKARAMTRKVLPYIVLIGGLVLTRLVPALKSGLGSLWALAPFEGLPAWSPLYHAGSWLLAGGVLTALLRRQGHLLGHEARTAWATGRPAVLAVCLFAMMAEVLSAAGISGGFADGMYAAFHEKAILATPLLSGLFGVLANSGNAPNSLFMSSQLALAAQAGLSIVAVAALQHVSGSAMSLFSPVRMSIAASLSKGGGQERAVYAMLLPAAAACLALLLLMAAAVVWPLA